jgi:hypothetical protein
VETTSVRLWPSISDGYTSNFHKIRYRSFLQNSSSTRHIDYNLFNFGHILYNAINTSYRYFPHCCNNLCQTRHTWSPGHAVQQKWVSWKSVQWMPHFTCGREFCAFLLHSSCELKNKWFSQSKKQFIDRLWVSGKKIGEFKNIIFVRKVNKFLSVFSTFIIPFGWNSVQRSGYNSYKCLLVLYKLQQE